VPGRPDRIGVLRRRDRALLFDFSRRCVERLGKRSAAMKLVMPVVGGLMEANVEKEAKKDGIVISTAARAFGEGRRPDRDDVEALVEKTKDLDREFLSSLYFLPLSVDIDYRDVEPLRRNRIERMLAAVNRLLGCWEQGLSFKGAVGRACSKEGFRDFVREMLHLYSLETRALGLSMRLPPPAGRLGAHIVEEIYSIMEEEGRGMALEHAEKLFSGKSRTRGQRT
jgi:hypothetical protein